MPLEIKGRANQNNGLAPLTQLEIEGIELSIHFLRLLGMPKSLGEIYGLLFVSPHALPMDELMARLNLSIGAASQGLKLLRSFGAVRVTYIPGDRRDHYEADLELSQFASTFIRDELQPRVDRALIRIEKMEQLLAELPSESREETQKRVLRLRHWLEKSQNMLPWLLKFLVN